ncbi:hypothetical protein HK101_005493, partial [Irineochytrium annulatum]
RSTLASSTAPVASAGAMAPDPNFAQDSLCQSAIGIPETLATEEVFRMVLEVLMAEDPTADQRTLYHRAVGRLSLGWVVAGIPSLAVSAAPQNFTTSSVVRVRMLDARQAVAFDLVLGLLLVSFVLGSAGAMVGGMVCVGQDARWLLERRQRWSPLWRVVPETVVEKLLKVEKGKEGAETAVFYKSARSRVAPLEAASRAGSAKGSIKGSVQGSVRASRVVAVGEDDAESKPEVVDAAGFGLLAPDVEGQ